MRGTDELWEGVLGGSVNTRATVLAQPPDVQQRIRDERAGSSTRTGARTASTCPSRYASRRVGAASPLGPGVRSVNGVTGGLVAAVAHRGVGRPLTPSYYGVRASFRPCWSPPTSSALLEVVASGSRSVTYGPEALRAAREAGVSIAE
jgi:hypothetical protein